MVPDTWSYFSSRRLSFSVDLLRTSDNRTPGAESGQSEAGPARGTWRRRPARPPRAAGRPAATIWPVSSKYCSPPRFLRVGARGVAPRVDHRGGAAVGVVAVRGGEVGRVGARGVAAWAGHGLLPAGLYVVVVFLALGSITSASGGPGRRRTHRALRAVTGPSLIAGYEVWSPREPSQAAFFEGAPAGGIRQGNVVPHSRECSHRTPTHVGSPRHDAARALDRSSRRTCAHASSGIRHCRQAFQPGQRRP